MDKNIAVEQYPPHAPDDRDPQKHGLSHDQELVMDTVDIQRIEEVYKYGTKCLGSTDTEQSSPGSSTAASYRHSGFSTFSVLPFAPTSVSPKQ